MKLALMNLSLYEQNKIAAINTLLRMSTLGHKEAKDCVEAIARGEPQDVTTNEPPAVVLTMLRELQRCGIKLLRSDSAVVADFLHRAIRERRYRLARQLLDVLSEIDAPTYS